jgi:hypothetical protein
VQPETKFVTVKFGESDKSYDYLLPADFDVSPGQRVMVPMRGREVSVQVVEVKDHSDLAKVAIARLDVRTDEQRAASGIRTARTCGRRTARCWTRTATGRSSTTWTSRPMSKVRALIVFLYMPVIITAFIVRLQREIRSAFWFAWNDVRIEHDDMRRWWRDNQLFPEDWK